MAKLKYIVFNLKNRLVYDEIKDYAKELGSIDCPYRKVVAPGDCYLSSFQSKKFDLCAQDISTYDFMCTGEVGGNILTSLHCKYVLIGHSERRKLYDDEYTIEKKVKNVLKNNLKALYFVGEDTRQNPFFLKELIKLQIRNVLDYVDPNDRDNVYIVYEPSWLIGKEDAMLVEDIVSTVLFIKDYVSKKYFFTPKVLYGGGISLDDISKVLKPEEIDGVVISSISKKLKELKDILE